MYKYLINYLRGMIGGRGVLLSYFVMASNKIHANTEVDDLVTSYATHNEEMVNMAPIILAGNLLGMEEDGPLDDYFVADRRKVWDIIYPLIIKTETWKHIKRARTICERRKAMLAFHDHFMGPKTLTTSKSKQNRSSCTFHIREK